MHTLIVTIETPMFTDVVQDPINVAFANMACSQVTEANVVKMAKGVEEYKKRVSSLEEKILELEEKTRIMLKFKACVFSTQEGVIEAQNRCASTCKKSMITRSNS